jgi:hypothetical protein
MLRFACLAFSGVVEDVEARVDVVEASRMTDTVFRFSECLFIFLMHFAFGLICNAVRAFGHLFLVLTGSGDDLVLLWLERTSRRT